MPIPDWLAVGQVLVPLDEKKDVPVSGALQFILPLSRVEVKNIRGTFVTVSIPGLHGDYYLDSSDLVDWKALSSDPAANIDWLKPGSKLIDMKGQRYLLSAVMGTEVILRKASIDHGAMYLDGLVRMPIALALETLTAEEPTVVYRNQVESPKITYPDWISSRVTIRDRRTDEDFVIRDVIPERKMCRLQPIIWVFQQPGENGIYKISPTWIGVELSEMESRFDVQDQGGYSLEHRVCPECQTLGTLHHVLSPTRFYECPQKHQWAFIYDDSRKGRLSKNRFTLLLDD